MPAGSERPGEYVPAKSKGLARPKLSDVQGAFLELDMNSGRADRKDTQPA